MCGYQCNKLFVQIISVKHCFSLWCRVLLLMIFFCSGGGAGNGVNFSIHHVTQTGWEKKSMGAGGTGNIIIGQFIYV